MPLASFFFAVHQSINQSAKHSLPSHTRFIQSHVRSLIDSLFTLLAHKSFVRFIHSISHPFVHPYFPSSPPGREWTNERTNEQLSD